MKTTQGKSDRLLNSVVVVSALGYFVDIYDLILFSIVRMPSLTELGLQGEELFDKGVLLLNIQMIGMLVGGLFWGILGDKRGRLSVLFGSILLYSLANIANGFVTSVEQYAILRFIAGIGLAGELGAGITLVAEILPTAKRGYGTTLVAAFGLCGAVLAYGITESFNWRVAYFIGGGLGLLLLVLRFSVFESGLFQSVKRSTHWRGDFGKLFHSRDRFVRYLCCILIGVPIWYIIGILVTFSPEFARELKIDGPVSAGKAVMMAYVGLAIGDLCSGLLSQWLRSRKKSVLSFLAITAAAVTIYLQADGWSPEAFYWLCLALGFGAGYWAIFVTIATEQFGTNLRATVTTTVPNFVRGSVVPLTLAFSFFREPLGTRGSGALVGVLSLAIAFLALRGLDETFSKDMECVEE